jgi:hypothetical protein
MMFRDMAKNVCGVLCAAVMCCCGSDVSGMVSIDGSEPSEFSLSLWGLTEHRDEAKYVKDLAIQSRINMEKMQELVKYLCDPKIPVGLCNFAKCEMGAAYSPFVTNVSREIRAEWTRRLGLLAHLTEHKSCNGMADPAFFWEEYKNSRYELQVWASEMATGFDKESEIDE